ncbi:MAG TPA: efflux RND transporter periplasmic adaptor subunit [Thermoanaerobaculia bacterium]|jgi:HlyD family secretion protein|nr:efflux RND transporter periplasmic adaptor subunit [Thermoanaerobaculia bacterium]
MTTQTGDTPTTADKDAELARILSADSSSPGLLRRGVRWAIIVLVIALGVVGVLLYLKSRRDAAKPEYVTAEVTQGNLTVTVAATGSLAPTHQVDVGSELSGTVETVLVDDNDQVQEGQVLARLDTSKLNDAVAKSRADLSSAQARVAQTQATLTENRATLARFREVAQLSGGKVPSKTEMDTAEANVERAAADVQNAQGTVQNTRADLRSNETNVTKATIRSPIKGVVLARKVEPGQTVAASLSAPVLFTIAENLAQMELQVAVDEADVGDVRAGESATFSVDAYPERTYRAQVTRVGLGSTTTEGIVSYLTILTFTNDDLSLRPGMTGNAEITTMHRQGVLLVPNAALRWSPSAADRGAPGGSGGGLMGSLMPRPPRFGGGRGGGGRTGGGQGGGRADSDTKSAKKVWVLRQDKPVPIDVKVGSTDGRMTEVTSPELKAGMDVITETAGAKP